MTGGSAFPYAHVDPDRMFQPDYSSGMTLRDYFAAAVMPEMARQAAAMNPGCVKSLPWTDGAVQAAYAIADAMLAERAK